MAPSIKPYHVPDSFIASKLSAHDKDVLLKVFAARDTLRAALRERLLTQKFTKNSPQHIEHKLALEKLGRIVYGILDKHHLDHSWYPFMERIVGYEPRVEKRDS